MPDKPEESALAASVETVESDITFEHFEVNPFDLFLHWLMTKVAMNGEAVLSHPDGRTMRITPSMVRGLNDIATAMLDLSLPIGYTTEVDTRPTSVDV